MSTLTRSLETLRDRRARGERPVVSVGDADHEFLGVRFGGSSPSVSLVDASGQVSSKTAADWKRLGAVFRGRSRDLVKSTKSAKAVPRPRRVELGVSEARTEPSVRQLEADIARVADEEGVDFDDELMLRMSGFTMET